VVEDESGRLDPVADEALEEMLHDRPVDDGQHGRRAVAREGPEPGA
jgi:hypothetical protein